MRVWNLVGALALGLTGCATALFAGDTAPPTDAQPSARPIESPDQLQRTREALCGDAGSLASRSASEDLACGDFLLELDGPAAAVARWHNAYLAAEDVTAQCAAIQRIKEHSMALEADLKGVPALVVQRCGELAAARQQARASRQLQAAVQSSCRASCSSQYETCVASAEGFRVLGCDDAKRACFAGCQ